MTIHKPIIKTLWIGPSLSLIEQLSLKSFLDHGHEVQLFGYDKIGNVPTGVILRDANEILTKDKIFYYDERPLRSIRRRKLGSVAAFANWFRYKMLYDEGGVWVDTDIVCLKPFNFKQQLFFGCQASPPNALYNNAVLGAGKGSELCALLMHQAENPNAFLSYDSPKVKCKKIVRKYLFGNQRGRINGGEVGPTGLTKAVQHLKLEQFAMSRKIFYPIRWRHWRTVFDETYPDVVKYFPDSHAIHLWNKMFKDVPNFDKNDIFPANSLIEILKRKHL